MEELNVFGFALDVAFVYGSTYIRAEVRHNHDVAVCLKYNLAEQTLCNCFVQHKCLTIWV